MPSFPSYYLNNLERKRQRSADLREGLNKGMAGVLGGVDRLAQMQQALEGKALDAEALKHGRDIEAQNQARADQRFAWEGEDRERKNAQNDQRYWLELQRNATHGNAALGGEPASAPAAPGETSSDVLAKMQGYLGGQEERPGGPQTEEPPPMSVYDLDKAAEVAEEGEPETTTSDILARMESTLSESRPMAPPIVPSNADRIEEERLRTAQLKNQILERRAKGGSGAAPGVTSKKEIDRQLAALRLKNAEAKAASGGVSTTDVDKVRKEFNALPVVKQYHDVEIAADKMRAMVENPSAAGDISLIFNFMKMNDPQSTVREGEFATAQNATGVPERIRNEYNRLMSGDRLGEAQRADFLAQGERFLAAHKKAYDAAAESYSGLATRRGMAPGDVVMGGQPAPDPQAAFLKTAVDLAKQLGRKPTKEELQDAMRAAGVLE